MGQSDDFKDDLNSATIFFEVQLLIQKSSLT